MKPKDYVDKYQLFIPDNVNRFNHNEFISDLTIDFMTSLEIGRATENIKGYENAVNAIRMKWNGINNKTVGKLPDKLWNYFYATVIAKMREQLFPTVMAERRRKEEERKRWREEYNKFTRRKFNPYYDFFSFFNFSTLLSLIIQTSIPESSFTTLNLATSASIEDVKDKFRELSMKYHPDKGGNQNDFIRIVEAKNKCLAYLTNKL
jgi:hypothetical protein